MEVDAGKRFPPIVSVLSVVVGCLSVTEVELEVIAAGLTLASIKVFTDDLF